MHAYAGRATMAHGQLCRRQRLSILLFCKTHNPTQGSRARRMRLSAGSVGSGRGSWRVQGGLGGWQLYLERAREV